MNAEELARLQAEMHATGTAKSLPVEKAQEEERLRHETPSILKRRARQKLYYKRKKERERLSLKAEDIERRRIAREDREARRAERKRQAELRASEDAASLPAPRLDKTAEWNAGFLACYLTMKPCIEEREAELRALRARMTEQKRKAGA
jgi:hypothetical protein